MAQSRELVRIRRNGFPDVSEQTRDWAARLADHAALAAIVYRDGAEPCIADPRGWALSADPADTVDDRATGLYFEVWEHARETAIVFRGTEGLQWRDWWSNLRWVTRFLPIGLDQYDALRAVLGEVVARASARRPGVPIVAVGHSLGGGLAQHAAYACPDIVRALAFDPSPVTGFRSLPRDVRTNNAKGLLILRIYEAGEILAYLRGGVRKFVALSTADPEIVEVRFNFHGAGLITQHSIKRLAVDLYELTLPDQSREASHTSQHVA